MKVSLLTIGNELLKGATVNTNASWIGKNLFQAGALLVNQLTVQDDDSAIQSALNHLFNNKPDVIIITGGLGPTADDITRETLFNYFGARAIFDHKYWNSLSEYFLKRIGKQISEINKSQAMVPNNGELIPNPVGSARGFIFNKNETKVFALPGVPIEMKSMMNDTIIPWVIDKKLEKFNQIRFRTTGKPESSIAEMVEPILNQHGSCYYGFFPSAYGVDIVITSESNIDELDEKVSSVISDILYTKSDNNIEDILIETLVQQHKTLGTAESCTGGLIGHRITQVSGSSDIYTGGIISYSNNVKETQLNVHHETLIAYGAVSEQTAKEMAIGVRKILGTTIGLSITGIAGPSGGTKEKPVGLVYIGYSDEKITFARKFLFGKDRTMNKIRSSQAALNLLLKELLKEK